MKSKETEIAKNERASPDQDPPAEDQQQKMESHPSNCQPFLNAKFS